MKTTINTVKTILASLILFSFTSNLKSQVIFLEDFNGGIPPEFTLIDNDGNTVDASVGFVSNAWVANIVSPGDSAALSTSWYSPAGTSDDWLITPSIQLGQTNFLSWDAAVADPSFPDGYEVRISTTGTSILNFLANPALFTIPAESPNFTSHSVSLSAYANKAVYIAFVNNSTDKYLLYIDNISVFAPTGNDLELASLVDPKTNGCYLTNSEKVTVQIKNNGSTDISGATVSYQINNRPETIETINDTIRSGGSFNYTFIDSVDLSGTADSIYKITTYVNVTNDIMTSNDTLAKYIFSSPANDLTNNYSTSFESDTSDFSFTWTIGEDVNADNQTWKLRRDSTQAETHTGIISVSIPTSTLVSNDDWFFSPCLLLTSGTRYKLSFWYMAANASAHNIKIKLGPGNNASYMTTDVADFKGISSDTFTELTATITAPSDGIFHVGFQDYSEANTSFPRIYIDDIKISNLPPQDGSISKLISPAFTSCTYNNAENITVKITNAGNKDISNFTVSNVFSGNTVTATITDTVQPGTSMMYTFGNTIDLSTPGSYQLDLYISVAGDSMTGNDTLTATLQSPDSNVPMYSGFDGASEFAGWHIDDESTVPDNGWFISTFSPLSAPNCVTYVSNTDPATEWLYTHCFKADPGKKYALRFFTRIDSSQFTHQLDVYFAKGDTSTIMNAGIKIGSLTLSADTGYIEHLIDPISAPDSGNYYIGFFLLSDPNMGRLKMDNVTLDFSTSVIDKKVESGVSVYPNPSYDRIYINQGSLTKDVKITLNNTYGQVLSTITGGQKLNYFSVKSLPEGIYIIKVQTNYSEKTYKVSHIR